MKEENRQNRPTFTKTRTLWAWHFGNVKPIRTNQFGEFQKNSTYDVMTETLYGINITPCEGTTRPNISQTVT